MDSVKAAATFPQLARARRESHLPSSLAGFRRMETTLVASLSIGAGAIHLAAATSHAELLGDLALGFYWAALFQVAFALAFLAHPGSRQLARVGVAVNLAIIGAWAWSRTIGLPMIPGGPESVGVADATTVVFQIVLVALLAARLVRLDSSLVKGRPAASLGTVARSVLVVGIGFVALSTTIAVMDGLNGHGNHGAAPHAHPDNEPAMIEPGPVDVPHGHGAATAR